MNRPGRKAQTATGPDVLYIDVLPVRTAEEVGGFSRAATRKRGVTVAVYLGRIRAIPRLHGA
jgi:hypothetical protein